MTVPMEELNQYELFELLSTIQSGLLSVSENSEEDFLQLGHQLQVGYRSVTGLADLALSALQVTGAEESGGDFTDAYHGVKKALDELKNRREMVESKLPPVKEVVDYLDDLNSKRDEIEMIAKYLRAVALNIFIETARAEISNKNFSIIAEEIKELSENIIGMAKSIREDSVNAKNRFIEMYTNIASGITTMNSVTTDAEESVYDSIKSIDHLMKLSHQSVKQAEEMSREISREVGNIVVGVQFHDDMRQRLEHVVSAIGRVETLFNEATQDENQSNENRLASAYSIVKIQKAQVVGIIDELENIYHKNKASFENIIIEIEELVDILARDSRQDLGENDIFDTLSAALSDFQNLDSQGVELVKQLDEAYQQASVTTEALSQQANQIHEVSRESHIKALNAIIATQDMGHNGRTLLTLAGEMKTLSQQADSFVTDVTGIIKSILESVRNISIQETDDGVGKNDDEQSRLNIVVEQITSACAKMQSNSETIYKESEELSSSLATAKANLDFFPVISSNLNLYMNNLNDAMEILSPWAEFAGGESLENETYTMEKERKIHEQALDMISEPTGGSATDSDTAGAPVMSEPETESMTGDDEDEFDDNIELF